MQRVLVTIVSVLVSLSFAGIASAVGTTYSTDTHPPILENQPGLNADGGATKTEKKAKKKKGKKGKKAKKGSDAGLGTDTGAGSSTGSGGGMGAAPGTQSPGQQ
jgi:hypothetical protein